ncbi:MAG: hypothetical protein HYX92_04125 [Chloroflexi bacterium]|nr:hypothetical protein [Chloroflexota bacterium]
MICTTEFAPLAQALARNSGTGLVIANIPHPFSWNGLSRGQIRDRAALALPQVLAGLTKAPAAEAIA